MGVFVKLMGCRDEGEAMGIADALAVEPYYPRGIDGLDPNIPLGFLINTSADFDGMSRSDPVSISVPVLIYLALQTTEMHLLQKSYERSRRNARAPPIKTSSMASLRIQPPGLRLSGRNWSLVVEYIRALPPVRQRQLQAPFQPSLLLRPLPIRRYRLQRP